jgi:hypothetical protein
MRKSTRGLYSLFIKRLKEAESKHRASNIISFPDLFEKVCRNFSINKRLCWEILFILEEINVIEIVWGHGVKLKNNIKKINVSEVIS